MDLKIYQIENKLRNKHVDDPEVFNDANLIPWKNAATSAPRVVDYSPISVPENDPKILVPGIQKGFVERSEFSKRYQTFTKGVLNYVDWQNVAMAGGCPSNIMNPYCSPKYVSDMDLFIFGLSPQDAKKKLSQLTSQVKSCFSDVLHTQVAILQNKYTVTFVPHSAEHRKCKVQIILRLYRNIHEILAGFDVDSCAVAWNGSNILFTERSLNAFRTRLNVVDMERRSPSYEYRLSKYVKRGFGVYVPFEFQDKYNKMYFLNRFTKGLERLLYLVRYQRDDNYHRFVSHMTQRLHLKVKGNISDYEGTMPEEAVQALTIGGSRSKSVREYVIGYNNNVPEEFRYKIYSSWSEIKDFSEKEVENVSFITNNPGQQFTGSFHPITNEEWILVDYSSQNLDFLGRNSLMNRIRANQKFLVSDIFKQNICDNSLFNPICYMIMYTENQEMIIHALSQEHRLNKGNHNLYRISYLQMAVLFDRRHVVNHLLGKDNSRDPANSAISNQVQSRGSNSTRSVRSTRSGSVTNPSSDASPTNFENIIHIAVMMDNVEMLKIIHKYHEFDARQYTHLIQKYDSKEVSAHYCVKLKTQNSDFDVKRFMGTTPENRLLYLYKAKKMGNPFAPTISRARIYDAFDYFKLSIDELRMINFLKGPDARVELKRKCLQDIKKAVVFKPGDENNYPANSLEDFLHSIKLQELQEREQRKSKERDQFAREVLRQLYGIAASELVESKQDVELFTDPVRRAAEHDPFILYVMKMIYSENIEELSRFPITKEIWDDSWNDVRTLLFKLDRLDLVKLFIRDDQVEAFLKKHVDELHPKLLAVYDIFLQKRLDMKNEQVAIKYADLFCNTDLHIKCVRDGVYTFSPQEKENVFGLTPLDYLFNQLLFVYASVFNSRRELEDSELDKLTKMRQSLQNVNRVSDIVSIERSSCVNPQLETVIKKI